MTENELHDRSQEVIRFLEEEINSDRPEVALAILDAARISVVAALIEDENFEPVRRALTGQAGVR